MKSKMIEVKAKPDFATKRLEHSYDAMRGEKFTDVNFTVGKQSFFAHMIVLSSCSAIFTKNSDNLSAIFSDFQYPIIDAMLKYCYLGEIHIEEKHYEKFKELAEKLKIESIAPQFLTVDRTNCLEVLRLSDDKISKRTAMKSTVDNFNTLYKTQDFLSVPVSDLVEILKSDDINVHSEEDVFNAVKLWVNFDLTNRQSELEDLLRIVKLPLLSMEFVVTEAMDLYFSSPKSIAILQLEMESIFSYCQSMSGHRNRYKIALVGDLNLDVANIIDIYNGRNKSWTLSKNFQFNRRWFASALVNNWIMIIGGKDSSHKAVNLVHYIDLKDGQKHPLKPLNQARFQFSAVTLRHESFTDVYAIGGSDNKKSLSSVERWNSNKKSWEMNVAPLLLAVCYFSASVIDGNIYVTGGRTWKNGKWKTIKQVQMYSSESNSWSYRAPMIQERDGHSSVVIKGKLFIVGGYILETRSKNVWRTGIYSDKIESYAPDTNLWIYYSMLPKPGRGISLCFVQNMLLLMGGEDGTTTSGNVWEYDIVSLGSLKASKSLSNGRTEAVAFVIPYDSVI
ncbi:kelch-like protein 25 [Arctopsyche grandis]|uniref:kelch-like protein 25 n=1 Tax=Arctopsyche grandis TaxID=121162 RepID=UPI00406D6F1A